MILLETEMTTRTGLDPYLLALDQHGLIWAHLDRSYFSVSPASRCCSGCNPELDYFYFYFPANQNDQRTLFSVPPVPIASILLHGVKVVGLRVQLTITEWDR